MSERITALELKRIRGTFHPGMGGYNTIVRLLDEIERLKVQADIELVKRLTLPSWSDVEDELVAVFREPEASVHEGVKAVYGRIQDMLVMELIRARAAAAGDDE